MSTETLCTLSATHALLQPLSIDNTLYTFGYCLTGSFFVVTPGWAGLQKQNFENCYSSALYRKDANSVTKPTGHQYHHINGTTYSF